MQFIKASASSGAGQCVEVAVTDKNEVVVRDSKQQGDGPTLTFTEDEWEAFLQGAAKGEFAIARMKGEVFGAEPTTA